MATEQLKQQWATDANKLLKGRTVAEVRYMTAEEQETSGWLHAAAVIIFDDGTWILPMRDDEGNDAGALTTSSEQLPIIPVI